jgi:hypothetical protein
MLKVQAREMDFRMNSKFISLIFLLGGGGRCFQNSLSINLGQFNKNFYVCNWQPEEVSWVVKVGAFVADVCVV